jgi:DNA-binding NarL/FixJ family response regulator
VSAGLDTAIRVLVVDDHPIWREGTARYLSEAGYVIAGTAGDGAQALRIIAATRPDVVLLDLNLPDVSGAEVARSLLAARPSARVLMLSASGAQQDVLDAVSAGAVGYVLKSAQLTELVDAVRLAAAGHPVFTPALAGLVLGEYRRLVRADGTSPPASNNTGSEGAGGTPRLTERETEVLRLVAKGMTYPQIAQRLTLSTRTVQNHVRNTLTKLQLHNKAQLVRYALENGADLCSEPPSASRLALSAARARFHRQPRPRAQLVPVRAGQRDLDRGAAVRVAHHRRRSLGPGEVPVAPGHEREQDRDQFTAGRGQPVRVALARAGLPVGGALHQAGLRQAGEPGGQDVPRDAKVARQLIEPADAVDDVPQHQQRPPVADEGERPGDGAGVAVVRGIRPHDGYRTHARLLLETQTRE